LSQIESVKEKLRVIRVLRLLKKNYTYEELSRITGLPITVLNRYVRGKVLPSTQRTRELIKILSPYMNLEEEVKRRIIFDKHGLFDNLKILSDNDLMNLIAESIASKYRDKKIDKILTAATDGIPLAIHIGNELGVDVVYAKKKREVGVEKFYEVNYVSSSSGSIMTLYLPHWAIKKGENILIVDDVVRSGETQKALLEMCKQANTTPVGMFFLISVGNVIDRIKEEYKIPVDVMIHL